MNIKKLILRFMLSGMLAFSMLACGDDIQSQESISNEQLALHNANRPYKDRVRDEERKADQLLKLVAVNPGMRVADLDAGNGYYTELFSYLVGDEGVVYLQNGNRFVTNQSHQIVERLRNNRLPNVVRLDSSFNNLELPKNLDIIFSSLVYHDIFVEQKDKSWNANVELYLPQLYKALKPGGKLIVIDHSSEPGAGLEVAQSLHRISEKFTLDAHVNAGFKLVSKSDLLRKPNDDRKLRIWHKKVYRKTDQFILIFTK